MQTALERQRGLFERLANSPDSASDLSNVRVLMVLSTPRSGSTLLCNILNNTGLIGWCDEWLNNLYVNAYMEVMGLKNVSLGAYLRFVIVKTVGDTGVFATHAHIPQLQYAASNGVHYDKMQDVSTVWVSRNSFIAQSVSLAWAKATGRWRSDEECFKEYKAPSVDDLFVSLSNVITWRAEYAAKYARSTDIHAVYEKFSAPGHMYTFDLILSSLGKTPPNKYGATLSKTSTVNMKRDVDQFTKLLKALK